MLSNYCMYVCARHCTRHVHSLSVIKNLHKWSLTYCCAMHTTQVKAFHLPVRALHS